MSADLISQCAEMKQEEREVLQAIYPDYVSLPDGADPSTITLTIPVDLDEDVSVHVEDLGNDTPPSTSAVLRLVQLPPVTLTVALPLEYPLEKAPTLLSLTSTSNWLARALDVWQLLLEMWMEGEGVLSAWVEAIQSGDILRSLGLYEGSLLRLPHPHPRTLTPILLAHSHSHTSSTFASTSFACSICLTSLKGTHCVQLSPCEHVFCRPCLTDFWGMCIAEGDVGRVGCPDPACVGDEKTREIGEEMVRVVLSEPQVVRWRWLQAKRTVERDPTMVHCPVPHCQAPVPKPALNAQEADSGWDRLRTCPSCAFSFCSFCKRSWHGPITPCTDSSTDAILDEYLALPADSPQRVLLERRHGVKWLRQRARVVQEERETQRFIEEQTTRCPSCRVQVQKSFGCNHMTCGKCREHFCYLCGKRLSANAPYAHFNDPQSPCHLKLFDALSQTDQDQLLDVALREIEL